MLNQCEWHHSIQKSIWVYRQRTKRKNTFYFCVRIHVKTFRKATVSDCCVGFHHLEMCVQSSENQEFTQKFSSHVQNEIYCAHAIHVDAH